MSDEEIQLAPLVEHRREEMEMEELLQRQHLEGGLEDRTYNFVLSWINFSLEQCLDEREYKQMFRRFLDDERNELGKGEVKFYSSDLIDFYCAVRLWRRMEDGTPEKNKEGRDIVDKFINTHLSLTSEARQKLQSGLHLGDADCTNEVFDMAMTEVGKRLDRYKLHFLDSDTYVDYLVLVMPYSTREQLEISAEFCYTNYVSRYYFKQWLKAEDKDPKYCNTIDLFETLTAMSHEVSEERKAIIRQHALQALNSDVPYIFSRKSNPLKKLIEDLSKPENTNYPSMVLSFQLQFFQVLEKYRIKFIRSEFLFDRIQMPFARRHDARYETEMTKTKYWGFLVICAIVILFLSMWLFFDLGNYLLYNEKYGKAIHPGKLRKGLIVAGITFTAVCFEFARRRLGGLSDNVIYV